MHIQNYILLAGVVLLSACSSGGGRADEGPQPPQGGGAGEGGEPATEQYANPVIPYSVPDPTCIRTADGAYYLYGTEDIRNLPILRSDDLVNWKQVGTAFTDQTRPTEVEGASLWAPEIRYIKGKYVLFYSLAIWGQEWVSTIGYAVADRPEGPFTEKGIVFSSHDVGVQNSIDEFLYEEDGKYYMLWGSFRGIYLMELDVTDESTAPTPPWWAARRASPGPTWPRTARRCWTTAIRRSSRAARPSWARGITPSCRPTTPGRPGCSTTATRPTGPTTGAWCCWTACSGTKTAGPTWRARSPRSRPTCPSSTAEADDGGTAAHNTRHKYLG